MTNTELLQDFIDKKELFADLIESYLVDSEKKEELKQRISEFKEDEDFKEKELFQSLFREIEEHIEELSRKDLKQRVLLIRSYLD
jgi:bacterioferritin (cytochrome b1)